MWPEPQTTPLEQTLATRQQPVGTAGTTPTNQPIDPAVQNVLGLLKGVNVNIDPTKINIVKAVNPDLARQATMSQLMAYVKPKSDIINLNNWTDEYRGASKGDKNMENVLAGTLAHEYYHVLHGPDEGPAYDEQLRVLQALHARSKDINKIIKAKEFALSQKKNQ